MMYSSCWAYYLVLNKIRSFNATQVHKNTKMGSVQEHTNEAGPECFKCGQVNLEKVLLDQMVKRDLVAGLQGQLPFKLKLGKSFIGIIYLLQVCKDNSNLRNHVLSHYYRIFDPLIPQVRST